MHIIQSKQRYVLRLFGQAALRGLACLHCWKKEYGIIFVNVEEEMLSLIREKVRMFCHRYIQKTFLGTQSLQNFPAFF